MFDIGWRSVFRLGLSALAHRPALLWAAACRRESSPGRYIHPLCLFSYPGAPGCLGRRSTGRISSQSKRWFFLWGAGAVPRPRFRHRGAARADAFRKGAGCPREPSRDRAGSSRRVIGLLAALSIAGRRGAGFSITSGLVDCDCSLWACPPPRPVPGSGSRGPTSRLSVPCSQARSPARTPLVRSRSANVNRCVRRISRRPAPLGGPGDSRTRLPFAGLPVAGRGLPDAALRPASSLS